MRSTEAGNNVPRQSVSYESVGEENIVPSRVIILKPRGEMLLRTNRRDNLKNRKEKNEKVE